MIITDEIKKDIHDILSSFEKSSSYLDDSCNCHICRSHYQRNEYDITLKIIDFYKKLYDHIPFLHNPYSDYMSHRGFYTVLNENDLVAYAKEKFNTILKYNEIDTFCSICGEPHIKSKHQFVYDNKKHDVCEKCVKTYFRFCSLCNSVVESVLKIRLDGKVIAVCSECHKSNKYCKCESCGNLTIREDKDNGWKTLDKYKRIFDTKLIVGEDYKYLCDHCGRERLTTCIECGAKCYSNKFCGKCEIHKIPVHQYNYVPTFEEFLLKEEERTKDTLFFGVELEFENVKEEMNRVTASTKIRSMWPETFLYCVHDGSLRSGENGLELVTMPFTWNYWKSTNKNWHKVFKMTKSCGFEGDLQDRAGCHIHLSKDSFTNYHLYKFLQFIFKKENRDFILKISNRVNKDDEYWSFESKRYGGSLVKLAKEKKNKMVEKFYNNRRTAVNVADKTVELRIFQSTTDLDVLSSYMEFCKGLFEFSKIINLKKLDPHNFVSYLHSKESSYMNILNFIKQMEVI